MITVLLTFLRLSSENEILAIKSGGISLSHKDYATLGRKLVFQLGEDGVIPVSAS